MLSRLRLVDLASGTDVFAYDSSGAIGSVGFPPNRDGMVFVESRSPDATRLQYLSADQSVVLGEWQTTQFKTNSLSDTYGTLHLSCGSHRLLHRLRYRSGGGDG